MSSATLAKPSAFERSVPLRNEESIVTQYMPLVRREARRAFRKMPRHAGFTVEDLVQEGWAQALYAARMYNPARLARPDLAPFLCTVVRHRYFRLAQQWWRREEIGPTGSPVDDEGVELPISTPGDQTVVETLVDAERILAWIQQEDGVTREQALRWALLLAVPNRYLRLLASGEAVTS